MAFSYYRSLTVDHIKVAANLTGFPVLVSISHSSLADVGHGGHVQNSNGYDICFYSDSGHTTSLFWEVEYYDNVNGILVAWVKMDLSSSVDTVFYMFYGDSGISTFQSTATSVWDTNYKGVWHLPNGTTLSGSDSTSNANTATNAFGSTYSDIVVSGKIDGAAKFNQGANTLGGMTTANTLNIGQATLSAWVYLTTTPGSDGCLITFRNGGSFDKTLYVSSALTPKFYIYDGASKTATSSSNISTLTWTYLVGVCDGSNVIIYVNGSSAGSTAAGNSYTGYAGPGVQLGGQTGGSPTYVAFNGDEFRVSAIARSSSWISTEYQNQNSPGNIGAASFITYGTETAVGGGGGSTLFRRTLGYRIGSRSLRIN